MLWPPKQYSWEKNPPGNNLCLLFCLPKPRQKPRMSLFNKKHLPKPSSGSCCLHKSCWIFKCFRRRLIFKYPGMDLSALLFVYRWIFIWCFLSWDKLGLQGILLKWQEWETRGGEGLLPPKLQSPVSTSSSRLLCSFCCSMRFCLSASSCLLYSSCSRSCCSCSSCCLRRASDRSLFSCCSLRKSRRRVDSPGTLTMELQQEEVRAFCMIKPDGPLNTFAKAGEH